MGFIYKITNKINGKIYIGQTSKTIERRFNTHIKNAKKHINRYLYDAMNCYGYDNFEVSQVEECDNALLDDREIYWIKYFNCIIPNGYNMTSGGGGGDTWTNNSHKDITREKIKQTKIKNGTYKKGALKGTPSPNKGNHKVAIDKDELLIDIKNFMSIEDICEKYHILKRSLYLRCEQYYGKTPTELRGDRLKHTNTRHVDFDKRVLLQYIKEGKTISDIAAKYNVSKETVRRRITEYFGKRIGELREHAC